MALDQEYPIVFIHRECGKPAFYCKRFLKEADPIDAADFLLLTGQKPINADEIICGSCGDLVWLNDDIVRQEPREQLAQAQGKIKLGED